MHLVGTAMVARLPRLPLNTWKGMPRTRSRLVAKHMEHNVTDIDAHGCESMQIGVKSLKIEFIQDNKNKHEKNTAFLVPIITRQERARLKHTKRTEQRND